MHSKILRKVPLIFLSLSLDSVLGVSHSSGTAIASRANNRTVLDDGKGAPPGKKYNQGKTNDNWVWQSTGVLVHGCTDDKIHITDCYSLQLSADTSKNLEAGLPEDAAPRQRIEFATGQKGIAGETHQYEWKFYLSSQTGTTKNFFHLMQLVNEKAQGVAKTGPVITLDARVDRVQIEDVFKQGCSGNDCPSLPLADFEDRTTLHRVTVTFGEKGHLLYVIQDADNGNKQLLKYEVDGNMGTGGSVKLGTYRAAVEGMTASLAAAGDFK